MNGARVGGPVRLAPTTYVAPGAVVVGDVVLGARSSVWFQAVVRGDSAPVEVGEDSNLQDGVVVHEDEGFPTRIGPRVTVGHRAVIHGCVIEPMCLIGMGAVVLTGARIGPGSLVAAGAVVREGQEVPPGSLVVGTPARVVGLVRESHREAIERGWTHYRDLAALYLGRGWGSPVGRDGAVFGAPPPAVSVRVKAIADLEAMPGHGRRWRLDPLLGPRLRARDARRLACVADLGAGGAQAPLGDGDAAPGAGAEDWPAWRARLVAELRAVDPAAWVRGAAHAERGSFSLERLIHEWLEEDLELLGPPEAA